MSDKETIKALTDRVSKLEKLVEELNTSIIRLKYDTDQQSKNVTYLSSHIDTLDRVAACTYYGRSILQEET
jgi:archaellum component FlaC